MNILVLGNVVDDGADGIVAGALGIVVCVSTASSLASGRVAVN